MEVVVETTTDRPAIKLSRWPYVHCPANINVLVHSKAWLKGRLFCSSAFQRTGNQTSLLWSLFFGLLCPLGSALSSIQVSFFPDNKLNDDNVLFKVNTKYINRVSTTFYIIFSNYLVTSIIFFFSKDLI